jgi:hypothetical protein
VDSQSFTSLASAGTWISKSLLGGVEPHYKQALMPLLAEKTGVQQHTSRLDSPDKLAELLQAGTVAPGQYVEGTAFFSRSTVSHDPMTLGLRINTIVEDVMRGLTQGRLGPPGMPRYVFPTTRFPSVHPTHRVAFLYPVYMYGFAVPLIHDGTTRSLPFLGRQVCILKGKDRSDLECRIVKYRARIITVNPDDLHAVYSGIADNDCASLLAGNGRCFLSIAEDNTFIEFHENSFVESSAVSAIIGSHFLETHWEQPEVLADAAAFPEVLQSALLGATSGRPQVGRLTRAFDDMNKLNLWYTKTIEVTQPAGLPYVHFRLTAPLNDRPNRQLARDAFHEISDGMLDHINRHYSVATARNDLNSIDNYSTSRYTLLQSSAARMINKPVLTEVRGWLARKL